MSVNAVSMLSSTAYSGSPTDNLGELRPQERGVGTKSGGAVGLKIAGHDVRPRQGLDGGVVGIGGENVNKALIRRGLPVLPVIDPYPPYGGGRAPVAGVEGRFVRIPQGR